MERPAEHSQENREPAPAPALTWRQRLGARLGQLHGHWSRVFWTLHSVWALTSGTLVLILARNRWGYVPWVVGFIGLTWASTLFFSKLAARFFESAAMRFAKGFASWATRAMYQNTLFFLIPFYFYSATLTSSNVLYLAALTALAGLACLDMVFDRLLRDKKWFALGFFAFVTFSALQFFLPLVFRVRIHNGAYLAAGLSILATIPLAYTWAEVKQHRRAWKILAAFLVVIAVLKVARMIIPPVPLRVTSIVFSGGLDTKSLIADRDYVDEIPLSALSSGRLYARAAIFAPVRLATSIRVRFIIDGDTARWSRALDIHAHDHGFRVWDVLRAQGGAFKPCRIRAEVWTREGQLVGRRDIRIVDR